MPAPVDVAHSLHGATVKAPARWFAAPYRGMPATVVFPVVFLSTSRFAGVCSAGHANPAACTTPNWFPPDARTPADGVLVLWTHVEIPSDVLNTLDGRPVRINGHTARLYSGAATAQCAPGSSTEVDAYVRAATAPVRRAHEYSGERFDMTACLGPHASAADRAAVLSMVRSLQVPAR